MEHSIRGYLAILFPFMADVVLTLHVLVSITFVMIIVLITNGYKGYAQRVTSRDYLTIIHVLL